VGSTFCGSSASRAVAFGHDEQRAGHQEHGHEGEEDVAAPPITVPRTAAFSLLADITRWNTSCCGIEPSIMVMAAPKKNRISCQLGSGRT
jgi:hypothetical protein